MTESVAHADASRIRPSAGVSAGDRFNAATAPGAISPRYLDDVRRYPLLEPQQEYLLAKSWRHRRERDAAHRLVTSHLRLVVRIAAQYRGYGLPLSELISEGNIGLMHAVNGFQPDRGCRFATYAIWWIKAEIQQYVLRSWSLVRIGTTANQKKLFFGLRRAKGRIAACESGDLRPDQVETIAVLLGVRPQEVVDMNRRLGGDVSLNAPIDDDRGLGEWQDRLIDDRPDPEIELADTQEDDNRRTALREALTVLSARERRIFERRQLAEPPATLEKVAEELGISAERTRQIEVRAFDKVQRAARRHLAATEGP